MMFQLISLVLMTILVSLLIFALLWFLRGIARSLFDDPVCAMHAEPACSCTSVSAPFSERSDRVFNEGGDSSPIGVAWH